MKTKHEYYIKRCLELAARADNVSPNPRVGCIIVAGDEIIGEGYHEKCGGPHAEVNAVNSVKDSSYLKDSTIYVSLEPCSHYGKTPPCAELIINSGIPKVVAGTLDPNPSVSGKGFEMLREAGVDVESGFLQKECIELNCRFFVNHSLKRPWIILKWAETADHFIARRDYSSKWISTEESRKLVHQWRAEEMAIMVGTNTAVYDNPELTVRNIKGSNPVRILLDRSLRVPEGHKLFDGSEKTIVFTEKDKQSCEKLKYIKVPFSSDLLNTIVHSLKEEQLFSLIVEGGSQLLKSFIDQDLWDEFRVFRSSVEFEEGIAAPDIPSPPEERLLPEGDYLLTACNDSVIRRLVKLLS